MPSSSVVVEVQVVVAQRHKVPPQRRIPSGAGGAGGARVAPASRRCLGGDAMRRDQRGCRWIVCMRMQVVAGAWA